MRGDAREWKWTISSDSMRLCLHRGMGMGGYLGMRKNACAESVTAQGVNVTTIGKGVMWSFGMRNKI